MKFTALVIISTLLVTPTVASAGVSVLGITLGGPLDRPAIEGPFASTLPSPGVRSFVVPLAASEKREFIKYPTVVARTLNDKVVELTIFTRGVEVQDAALRQLRDLFGEPARLETRARQPGAILQYYDATWRLGGTEVRFEAVTSDRGTGAIHVTTLALRPKQHDQADPHL
jgi:hypothetical protein